MKSDKKSSDDWKKDWERAKNFLTAAENNLKLDDYKTAANRAYFTAESAVVAALKLSSKPTSKIHKNIWTYSKLLGLEIDTFSLLRDLYDLRLQADYGNSSEIIELTSETLNDYMAQVKELCNMLKLKYNLE